MARSRDEMRWSLCIEESMKVKMPADHACRTIAGVYEMNEMSERKLWNEICGRRKLEKPREQRNQSAIRPPRNQH